MVCHSDFWSLAGHLLEINVLVLACPFPYPISFAGREHDLWLPLLLVVCAS